MSDESAVLRLTTAAHSDVVIAEDDGNAVYLALRCRLWVSGVEVKIPAAGSGKLILSLKQTLESGVKEFKIRAFITAPSHCIRLQSNLKYYKDLMNNH